MAPQPRLRHRVNRPSARPQAPEPAAPPSAPRDRRADVVFAATLNVLAGIWLIIAPFVLGYSDGDPYWNDIVFGAVVLVLAGTMALGAYRATWLSSVNMLVGIWIVASAFWLDSTARAGWNDVILGIVVFLLAAVAAGASDRLAANRPVSRRGS